MYFSGSSCIFKKIITCTWRIDFSWKDQWKLIKNALYLSLRCNLTEWLSLQDWWVHDSYVYIEDSGPVHTMPVKFENATLLLRIRLPSTLIRIKRSTKTELFENALQSGTIWKRYFFVLVWTENFLYPQLFEYTVVILSCNLSSQVINMVKNMIFWNFESKQPPKTL